MHPIFRSYRSLLTTLVLWAFLCGLIALLLTQLTPRHLEPFHTSLILLQTLPWYFLYLFFCLSNFYLCERFPQSTHQWRLLILVQAIGAFVTVGLWLLLGKGWSETLAILGFSDTNQLYYHTFVANSLMGLVLYVTWVLVHYTYLTAKGNEANNAKALMQQLLISSIELQALKATIHPHFMYNSLNMLANLSLTAPNRIHDICVQMSEFLRYSVNYSKRETVTLRDEVTQIENYLAIEIERFGERLTVELNAQAQALEVITLPLLLFPLVENSIKHGIQSQSTNGFIKIDIKLADGVLMISVENSVDSLQAAPYSTNLGLSTLKKRLASYYGKEALMLINATDRVFTVTLKLPPLTTRPLLPQANMQ